MHLAKFETVLTEFQRYQRGETRRIVGAEGLSHDFGRHYAIFHKIVGQTGELAAVAQRMAEKPVHCLVVHRAFSEVDDALEEQIGFLKLVRRRNCSFATA